MTELGLLVTSAALFFLSFPNPLTQWGYGFLGFVALLPLFVLFNRCTWPRLLAFGPVAGFFFYLSINYWLGAYHPLAILIVPLIMAAEYLVLGLAWRMARALFPRYGFWLQCLVWVGFEYAKTQGFLGYPYGLLAYTQYLFLPLARLSSLTGIWGVGLLVVFPSVWLAWLLSGPTVLFQPGNGQKSVITWFGKVLLKRPLPGIIWLSAMALALVWGCIMVPDFKQAPLKKMILVQQNMDPWIGGTGAYAESLDRLSKQTDLALAAHPDTELVIWSETSFIPAIEWHFQYREDEERFRLVQKLKNYLSGLTVPVIIGNGEAEARFDVTGRRQRVDYNAAVLYDGGQRIASYRKLRLVPFTEHFPYQGAFPWLYQLLVDNNTSFWEAGTDYVLLEAAGIRMGTPICFEDSFGYLNRDFVNRGAQVLVNLTNDLWSKSVPAAMQHLAMATFRSHETARTMVRSTNGGMSALITPDGRIADLNQPFTLSWLYVEAPVLTGLTTPYLYWGDWFGLGGLWLACLGLILGLIRKVVRLIRPGQSETD